MFTSAAESGNLGVELGLDGASKDTDGREPGELSCAGGRSTLHPFVGDRNVRATHVHDRDPMRGGTRGLLGVKVWHDGSSPLPC